MNLDGPVGSRQALNFNEILTFSAATLTNAPPERWGSLLQPMNSFIGTGLLIILVLSGLYTCFCEYRDAMRDARKFGAEKGKSRLVSRQARETA